MGYFLLLDFSIWKADKIMRHVSCGSISAAADGGNFLKHFLTVSAVNVQTCLNRCRCLSFF